MSEVLQNTAPATKEIKRWTQEERTAYNQREIAAGRHSTTFKTVCDGCRLWVTAIWTIVPGSKLRLCRNCVEGKGAAK